MNGPLIDFGRNRGVLGLSSVFQVTDRFAIKFQLGRIVRVDYQPTCTSDAASTTCGNSTAAC
jgi:hypothetical protein